MDTKVAYAGASMPQSPVKHTRLQHTPANAKNPEPYSAHVNHIKHRHDEQQWAESWEQVDGSQHPYNDLGDWEMPSYHHHKLPKPQMKNTDFRCRHGQPIICQTCGEWCHKS